MADPMPPPDRSTDHTTDRSSGASSYDGSTDTTYGNDTTYGTTETTYNNDTARGSRGISAGRHLASVLFALLLVPAAYVLLDYGFLEALGDGGGGGQQSTDVIVTVAIAVACFFAAAATGRMSALGPLVAALVWGAALTLWVLLDFDSYAETLGDLPNLYDDFGSGLLAAGFTLYPAATGLLLGTAVAGRWRGSR